MGKISNTYNQLLTIFPFFMTVILKIKKVALKKSARDSLFQLFSFQHVLSQNFQKQPFRRVQEKTVFCKF